MATDDRIPDEYLQKVIDESIAKARASEEADSDARRAARGLGWVLLTAVTVFIGLIAWAFGADPGHVALTTTAVVALPIILHLINHARHGRKTR